MIRFLVGLAVPVAAFACSCISPGPPCSAAGMASFVFAGSVVEVTREMPKPNGDGSIPVNGFLGIHAIFQVSEAFFGMEGIGKQVEIRTGMGGGDCGYPFERGQSYLVYGYLGPNGERAATICSGTKTLDKAEADLEYLRSPAVRSPFGFMTGVVGDVEGKNELDQTLQVWHPAGLEGVTVKLSGSVESTATTQGDGVFRFERLPPGKYRVTAAKEGYRPEGGNMALDVKAGRCAYAFPMLSVDRRISGTVTGADGLPAANVHVELVPTRPTQQNELPYPAKETRTTSSGTFKFENVRSGEYYLGVNLARTPTKEVPYARYFYPGTEDPSKAATVIVQKGPGAATYNFSIPAPQTERSIEGSVRWPDGRPGERVWVTLEDIRFPWKAMETSIVTDANGRFKLSVFDGTRYRIHAVTMGRPPKDSFSAEPFSLGPGIDLSKPLQLILTRQGNSVADLNGKGLERWRAGLGF